MDQMKLLKAKFDHWFTDKTREQIAKDNELTEGLAEKKVTSDDEHKKVQGGKVSKDKCSHCGKPMSKCECENAMKADKAKAKKGKNKMGSMPPQTGSTPPPSTGSAPAPSGGSMPPKTNMAKNAKKGDKNYKKNMKESVTAKVVYGLREDGVVKRYAIVKETLNAAMLAAKRMAKTKDLKNVSFIDVVDVKAGLTKTIYETLENYKTRKRAFETHVVCSSCGCPELELSAKKTMIRCTKCGTEDLVENIEGVK